MLAFRYYNICMQSFFFILRIKVLFQRLKSSKDELKTKHSGSNVHSMATLHVLGLLHGILAALPGILAALHVLGYYMASWLHFRSWATTWHLGILAALQVLGYYVASWLHFRSWANTWQSIVFKFIS